MLTKYIDTAMKKAHYELLEDGIYYGEIPGFQGVMGSALTLEECRDDLRGALEGWLILKLWDNDDDIPVLGRLSLTPRWQKHTAKHEASHPARNRKAS